MNTSNSASATIDGPEREALRRAFLDQGFARVGFTSARPVPERVSAWVASGAHAGMEWMLRRPAARADPTDLLPGARSVICVGAAYPQAQPGSLLAAYACGEDYHRSLRAALERAVAALPAPEGAAPAARICVDTAPLLERAFAARAGLGWIGRNTMLLNETHGPWLMLAEVLTELPIAPDEPASDRCGSCNACVQACPTGALDGEYGLDARRCLSYWTIEHRGPLPEPWNASLGKHAFGCDDCLTACPFPKTPTAVPVPGPFEPRPELASLDAAALRSRSAQSFRRHFGSTPLERARKGGLLRNLDAIEAHPPQGASGPRPT